ncbi:T9SS type A sorting domain-containing protein [Lewinella sp. LCG006]|uniref:T9SS type A sorting domain-containing protein n=1 Tax=Lewinella sp. LCG006 TaxID=3231911 RepID=UPI0034616B87
MKKYFTLLLIFIFTSFSLKAQYELYDLEDKNLYAQTAIRTSDEGLLLISTISCYTPGSTTIEGCTTALYATKVNAIGDTLWNTQLPNYFLTVVPFIKAFENADGTFTLFSNKPDNTICNGVFGFPPAYNWYRTEVFNLDETGQLLNRFQFPDECSLSTKEIEQLPNGNFIATSNYSEYVGSTGAYYEGRITIMNKNGDILHEYTTPFISLNNSQILNSEDDFISVLYKSTDGKLALSNFDGNLNLLSTQMSENDLPFCNGLTNCAILEAYQNDEGEITTIAKKYGGQLETHVLTKLSSTLTIEQQSIYEFERASTYLFLDNQNILIGEGIRVFSTYQEIVIKRIDTELQVVDSVSITDDKDIRLATILPTATEELQLFGTYDCCNSIESPAKLFILAEDFLSPTIIFSKEEIPVTLYPNPTSEGELQVVFSTQQVQGYQYQIYDALGRSLESGELPNAFNTLDITALSAGIYAMVLFKEDQLIMTQKFIVR